MSLLRIYCSPKTLDLIAVINELLNSLYIANFAEVGDEEVPPVAGVACVLILEDGQLTTN